MQRTSGGKTEHTVVAPHKRIAVAAPHLAVNKLPRSLKCDVHVAVDGLELAYRVKEERDVSECVLCKLPRAIVPSQVCRVLPLYTTPELSLTVTGAPMISLRKPDGSRASFAAGAAVVVAPLGAGADIFEGYSWLFGWI